MNTKKAKHGVTQKTTTQGSGGRKHTQNLKRLARIRGQVDGVDKMLREERYCPEIIQQIRSVRSALKGLECAILEGHLRGCVRKAFTVKDSSDAERAMSELIDLMKAN